MIEPAERVRQMLARRASCQSPTGEFKENKFLTFKIGPIEIRAHLQDHYDGPHIRGGGSEMLVMHTEITTIPNCSAAFSLVLELAAKHPYVALCCPGVREWADVPEMTVAGTVVAYSKLVTMGLSEETLDLAIRGLTHHFLEIPEILAHDPAIEWYVRKVRGTEQEDETSEDEVTDDEPPTLPEDDESIQEKDGEREENSKADREFDKARADRESDKASESPEEQLEAVLRKNLTDSGSAIREESGKINEALVAQVLSDLDELVGMDEVKSEVKSLVKLCRLNAKRAALGLNTEGFAPHLVLSGNSGTGKTTVARIIGDLYRGLGILKRGHVIETDRSKLIGAFIGQTAIKTRKVCKKAHGGVLFIDEAYGLSDDKRGFGGDAIETILLEMENQRGKMAVVVAGYTEKMKEFIAANPGLRSRFDRVIEFPDYSVEELVQIFEMIARKRDYYLDNEAKEALRRGIEKMDRFDGFGNGREVRRWVDQAIECQARLLDQLEQYSEEELLVISVAAIESVFTVPRKEDCKLKFGFCV